MIEILKNLAVQKLKEKMFSNSLNETATNEAASEGANALMESIQGGDISQITALFGGAASAEGSNNVLENITGKISSILQNKGMSAEEASSESSSVANDLVAGLKEKFQSEAEEDSGFDLSNITGLLGGNAGDIIGKVVGGNAGDMLNKAKNLFG